jgi:anti-sigma factor RsiW
MTNLTPNTSEQCSPEKFELLSAYLDGEVSASERHQVESWLAQDPKFRQTYRQLTMLQNGFKTLPVKTSSAQTEQLVNKVLARTHRSNRLWMLGGVGAAAAVAVSLLSGLLTGQNWSMRTAQQPDQTQPIQGKEVPMLSATRNDPSTLMIALERPPVEIPVVQNSSIKRKSTTDSVVNF